MVRIGQGYEQGGFGHNERMEYRQGRLLIVNTFRSAKEAKLKELDKELKKLDKERKMMWLDFAGKMLLVISFWVMVFGLMGQANDNTARIEALEGVEVEEAAE